MLPFGPGILLPYLRRQRLPEAHELANLHIQPNDNGLTPSPGGPGDWDGNLKKIHKAKAEITQTQDLPCSSGEDLSFLYGQEVKCFPEPQLPIVGRPQRPEDCFQYWLSLNHCSFSPAAAAVDMELGKLMNPC